MAKTSSKQASATKAVVNRMKQIHLRQHLRRVIKKCLKNPDCGMDIAAFESWKRLGYGGVKELGDFAKKVEYENNHPVIVDIYSTKELDEVLVRERKRGPSFEEQQARAAEKAAKLAETKREKKIKKRSNRGKKPNSAAVRKED
jgi:hypothetical protein